MKKSLNIMLFLLAFICVFYKNVTIVWAKDGQNNVIEENRKNVIWFGDSRTVYLGKAVYGYKISDNKKIYNNRIVARRSTQYSWANGSGYKLLKKRLDKHPGKTVIFNFGINDIGHGHDHKKSYIKLIQRIHKKYPKVRLCIMSVNPVKASRKNPYAKTKNAADRMNQKIIRFNSYIRRNMPKGCIYIDTNKNIIFSYIDGLHYTKATYRRIEKYVMKILGGIQNEES